MKSERARFTKVILVGLVAFAGILMSRPFAAAEPDTGAATKAVRAYVTNFGGDGISAVDLSSGRLIANIKTGSKPHGVNIAPDGTAV